MERRCGVLLPIASLPSKYGIGCFSKEAYEFVDFLKKAGQTYWQILPLVQTGYGDSPYQSCSTFAGNPYFIDPDSLVDAGYITSDSLKEYEFGGDYGYVDYDKIYIERFKMLRTAYRNSPFALETTGKWSSSLYDDDRKKFEKFNRRNFGWLMDYAIYSAIKDECGGIPFIEWDEGIRCRTPVAIQEVLDRSAEQIRFYEFVQYIFFEQWHKLKKYANDNGILIIGDLPIYVAYDSADTWSHPELFLLDENGYPDKVAGCPPDDFSENGQLWGNPLYCWDYHRLTSYLWWSRRMKHSLNMYDILRIDHFRGFESYYAIPYGDENAKGGEWLKGPGNEFFDVMKQIVGDGNIIAEDLGFKTWEVEKLLSDSGYPGMKVIEFSFSNPQKEEDLPKNFPKHAVVYTGTHDNQTLRSWYEGLDDELKEHVNRHVNITPRKNKIWALIRCALETKCDTAIIPMQDYLELDDYARVNIPSTLGGLNWRYRLDDKMLTPSLARKMRRYANETNRRDKRRKKEGSS